MTQVYLFLALSIAFEICGTAIIGTTVGFTKPFRSFMTLLLYFLCYFFFSKAIIVINLGIAYAIWSGIGIVSSSLISALFLKQPVSKAGLVGISFILAGCVIVNAFGTIG